MCTQAHFCYYLIQDENLVPELNDTNDPKGWIQKYAKNLMLDEEEHPVFLRAIPGEKGYEPMERHDIKQGDVVQARIMFEPYQLEGQSVEDGEGKAEWVCGVKLKMTEVMLIRKRGECSTLKVNNYVITITLFVYVV